VSGCRCHDWLPAGLHTGLCQERQALAARARLPIGELVQADIRGRMARGRDTYGTDLYAGNGREALRDAYEEALDLAMYLRQAMVEGGIEP